MMRAAVAWALGAACLALGIWGFWLLAFVRCGLVVLGALYLWQGVEEARSRW